MAPNNIHTQNKTNTQYITCLIIVILTIIIGYFLIYGRVSKLIDTRHYDIKIKSLNTKVEHYEAKIDSIENSIEIYLIKIAEYDHELVDLKYKLENYKKQHEKDINRINSLSNSDLEREFANTF